MKAPEVEMANEWHIELPVSDKMEPAWGPSEIIAMVAEMKAGFEIMKIKLEKLEEILSKKEKELDNAKETIFSLKNQINVMENGEEIIVTDSISERIDKK